MLKDRIQEDLKAAMMAKDAAKLSTIRMLKSAIQYYEIQKGADRAPAPAEGEGARLRSASGDSGGENRYEATDEDVVDVIGKEIKKRKESIELYKQGGRENSAASEQKEVEVLEGYLPEQMTEDEIRNLVKQAIEQTSAKSVQDMGKVMGALMPKVKGKADGTLVSNLVREALSS